MLKKVVITGANSGIGLATARILAQGGFDVVAVCRSEGKGKRAVEEIQEAGPKSEVSLVLCDLSDFDSVVKAADQINRDHPQVDVLINNAGYYPASIEYIGEVEKTLYASHLGHQLLTLKIMPTLEAVAEARIINVSSAGHAMGRVDRFFKKQEKINGIQAYGDAKLANILFSMGLKDHTPDTITSYSLHPGVVKTNFGVNLGKFLNGLFKFFGPLFLTPSKGAMTSVHLATAPIESLRPFNGGYFAKQKPKKSRNKDVHKSKADWLWAKSMDYLEPHL